MEYQYSSVQEYLLSVSQLLREFLVTLKIVATSQLRLYSFPSGRSLFKELWYSSTG